MAEVWSLCHQSKAGGHREFEGTLSKFLKGFFMLSAMDRRSVSSTADMIPERTEYASEDGRDKRQAITNRICGGETLCGYDINVGDKNLED